MDYTPYPRHDILCIDMRSFYASVEAVKLELNPMKTMLAVVGDMSRPGSIILAASPALKKKHGISNVSRYFELPHDPDIHIVQANMADYLHVSLQITKLLHRFAPREAIHTYSVDEIWITIDGLTSLWSEDCWGIARMIQHAILDYFGITSSIGIGDNKFLAKVVMDLVAKKAPEGIAECRYEDVASTLWSAPVETVWGIGSRMKRNLHRLGITTFGQIAQFPLAQIKKHFGIMGEQLYWHAWGIDLSPVLGDFIKTTQKSFGHGISLLRNYSAKETLVCILDLCEESCRRARATRQSGKTIHLAITYSTDSREGGFQRSKSIDIPTNITLEMYGVCVELFHQFYDGASLIRRVTVSLTNLHSDQVTQLDFFDNRHRFKDADYVMDSIRDRYGTTAILRASSYTDAGITIDRSKKIGGHYA